MAHGWRGDVPAAVRQYDAWTTNLMSHNSGIEAMRRKNPAFKPLLIGLHWPSEPFGNEDSEASFSDIDGMVNQAVIEDAVASIASKLEDTPEVREQLRTILNSYAHNDSPEQLPADVRSAYEKLECLLQLKADGEAAAPGADRPAVSPEGIYQSALDQENTETVSFGWMDSLGKAFLAPLRVLSFWKMKARARDIGEGGAHELLKRLHTAGRGKTRIHLMGHSFGCIVATGMAAGPAGASAPPMVSSLVLVQGALSLWAYCGEIPASPGNAGYFNPLIKNRAVTGPIVVTASQFDRAVRRAYPLAAGIAGQIAFAFGDELPTFGGLGVFGIQGLGNLAESGTMLPATATYHFAEGRVYNLESSNVISGDDGQQDAHSDIVHPEVAHVIWEAASV
ncbi:MAG: hypothetical protein WKF37_07380 [Bryobacteraceae bacterium]